MNNILPVALSCLIVFNLIPLACHAQELATEAATLADLSWLVGTWEGSTAQRSTDERWTDARGGIMLGFNRVVSKSGQTSFEFLRLQQTEDGITYYASPGGRAPVGFRLIKLENQTALFENPQHDFPQRIIYHREGDQMQAAIEGKMNGQVQRSEWNWRLAP